MIQEVNTFNEIFDGAIVIGVLFWSGAIVSAIAVILFSLVRFSDLVYRTDCRRTATRQSEAFFYINAH